MNQFTSSILQKPSLCTSQNQERRSNTTTHPPSWLWLLFLPRLVSSTVTFIFWKKHRKLSWLSSISDDPKVNNKPPVVDGTYHLLQDVQSGGPSTSGGRSTNESVYMYLNQWPMYVVHCIYTGVILPWCIARMLISKIKYGRYGVQRETDVVGLCHVDIGVSK
jgi:hypothetical protein